MAFCIYCGKQINDGEVCSCQQPAAPVQLDAAADVQPQFAQTQPEAQQYAQYQQTEIQTQQYAQYQQPEAQTQQYAQYQQPEAQTQQYAQYQQPEAQTQQYAQYQQPAAQTQQYAQYQQPAAQTQQYAQYQQPAAQAQQFGQPQVNQTAQYQTYPPAESKEKKKGKGLLIGLIGGGAALVAAVVILIICLSGGGYKSAINDIADAINDRETNIEKLAKAAAPSFISDPLIDAYEIAMKSDLADDLAEIDEELRNFYDEGDDEVGDGWTLKFDITAERELSESEIRKISRMYSNDLYEYFLEPALSEVNDLDPYDLEDIGSEVGISVDDMQKLVKILNEFSESVRNAEVTAGYELKGRIVVEDKTGSTAQKTDKLTIRVIKINGDWMIDVLSYFDDSISSLGRFLDRLF